MTLSDLSFLWPILVPMGVLLGFLTLKGARNERLLRWFIPVFLVAAVAFPFVTGGAASVPVASPVQFGIGLIALTPAVGFSAVMAAVLIRVRAPRWLLFGAPAATCVLAAPAVVYATLMAVCSLTGDCL